jgi:hypothetical protein
MHAVSLVGKPKGKKPREWLKRRGGDNIKVDLNDLGWQRVDWINLVEDREKSRAVVTKLWTSGFNRMQRISGLAEQHLACQEGFHSVESIYFVFAVYYYNHNRVCICVLLHSSVDLWTGPDLLNLHDNKLALSCQNIQKQIISVNNFYFNSYKINNDFLLCPFCVFVRSFTIFSWSYYCCASVLLISNSITIVIICSKGLKNNLRKCSLNTYFLVRSALMNKVTIKKLLIVFLWSVALCPAPNSKHKSQLYDEPLTF